MPEGEFDSIAMEQHPKEIRENDERASEQVRGRGRSRAGGLHREKQRRRDLSSAANVQQPFVVGRGEKFAFFVTFFFFLPTHTLPRPHLRRHSTDFFAFFLQLNTAQSHRERCYYVTLRNREFRAHYKSALFNS